MRRLTATLTSFALVAAASVALAVNSPASAAATPAVSLATGNSALPDMQSLLSADAKGYVYETLNAADQPTLWAQKLDVNGAADGSPVQLTGTGWTNQTANGIGKGLNLSIAGSMIASAGTPFTSFGSEQQRVGLYDLATGTASNPIITGFGDGGGFSDQVFFAGAAPDGLLFVALVPANGGTPASIHLMDKDQGGDAPADLGALPNASADPTYLADITSAASASGVVLAYPTATLDANNVPEDNLIYVPYNGDPAITLATGGSHGSFSTSLVAGGGKVAWANYSLAPAGGNGGCNYYTLPLDGSGNATPMHYNPSNVCDSLGGVTSTKLVFSPFPNTAGQGSGALACPATLGTCASGPLATLTLLDGSVTKSSSQNALSAVTDGTSLFFSQGTALGTAGIYKAASATSAASLFAAAATKSLWATSVSAAPGHVSWADDSTAGYPVQDRGVSDNGSTIDLGAATTTDTASVPGTASHGYPVSTSGMRTVYGAPPAVAGGPDRLLINGGAPQVVTTYATDRPSLAVGDPAPTTVQISGTNVLYLVDDPNGGYDGKLYSSVTHQTTSYPQAAAYALSGGFLATLGMDGSVTRTDLVANTAPVTIRPPTTLTGDQTVDVTGQVGLAGDYVSWLARECISTPADSTCLGNTEVGYRNAKTMAPAVTVVTAATTPSSGTAPTVGQNIAMSADYLVVDELNASSTLGLRKLVAVKLTDNSTTPVTSNNSYVSGAGKFSVDGTTVAWIDPTGAPMVKALDVSPDVPRVLTADAPNTVTVGTGRVFELVASTGFFNCGLTIANSIGTVVRAIDCTSDNQVGDVQVTWDGTDNSAQPLPPGAYTWTLNVASANGNLQDRNGVEGPATGTVNLLAATATHATWPASATYGAAFSVPVDVTSGAGTPTGSVTLKDGGNVLDTEPLVNGSATFEVGGATLTPGVHHLSVAYAGTTAFDSSSSSSDLTVAKASSTTTATFPAELVYGKAWTVKVSVSATGTTPTGTVTLKSGSSTLASHALSGGKATLTVAATKLKPGKHSLTLRSGGSATVATSSLTKTVSVAKAAATVSDSLDAKKIKASARATLSVRVTATGGVPLTGVIRVFDASRQIATAQLTAARKGHVAITLPKLAKGTHKIHSTYGGSATVAAATGATLTLTVTAA